MAVTSGDISGLLLAGLKTAFFNTYNEQAHLWDKISTKIPSDKDSEHYAWLGALPGITEFLDERKVADFREYDYFIKNKTWESTVSIDRAAMEDDQYGQVALRVRQMASTANTHLDAITYGLLGSGFTALCYDGLPFFGQHEQGRVQSNAGAGDLNSFSLQEGITAMMRFVDDKGRPMGVMPDTLVVPPELYWEASKLLTSAYFPDPVTQAAQDLSANPLRGMLTLVTSPFLPSSANWYLLDTKRVVKAIILQMRKDFEFSALEQNSETGFMRDVFYYGVRARYNVGFGDWRAAYGVNAE